MNDVICGHRRNDLREALSLVTRCQDQDAAIDYLTSPEVQVSSGVFAALRECNDPAKLAEMLAERGRQLGLCRMFVGIAAENVVHAHVGTTEIHRLLMFQARAILAAWLELQDGSHEEAEKALRG